MSEKTEKPDMAAFDLQSLIADRKANEDRPIRKGSICLKPSLVGELRDLEAEYELVKPDEDAQTKTRYADRPEHLDLADRVDAKQAEVDAASVVAVFKGLTQEHYEQLIRDHQETSQVEFDPILALEGFDHWERDGKRIAGTRDQFEELLTVMSRGEVAGLSRLVAEATNDTLDRPFSRRPSQSQRR